MGDLLFIPFVPHFIPFRYDSFLSPCLLAAALLTCGKSNAKAEVVAPEAGRVPAAIRRPADPGVVVPTPAPIHPGRAPRRTRGIRHRTGRIIPIPILAPLPDIAVHVVQPPGIGRNNLATGAVESGVFSRYSHFCPTALVLGRTHMIAVHQLACNPWIKHLPNENLAYPTSRPSRILPFRLRR